MVWNTTLSAVAVSGDDAEQFLQGQLSNDVSLLSETNDSQLTAYCLPNGRTIAIFRLVKIEQGFLLVVEQDVLEKALSRLTMFVMRSDVSFNPIAQRIVAGDQAIALSADAQWQVNGVYEALVDEEAVSGLGDGSTEHVLACIQRGIPSVTLASSEQHIPQMMNLDILEGINFKKGCYPGQEIIARMKYLGKLKRRMAHYTMQGPDLPEVNDDVLNSDGKKVGSVLMVASDGSQVDMLVVVQLDVADTALQCLGQTMCLVNHFSKDSE